jgi:hypothetical protein
VRRCELSFVSVESSQVVGWLNGRPGLLCSGTEMANIKLGVSGFLRNYSRSGSRVAVTDPQPGCSEKVGYLESGGAKLYNAEARKDK